MQKSLHHKSTKNVTKHASAKTATKPTKKIARLESRAEFRSKIQVKGKPLSQMVIEGRR